MKVLLVLSAVLAAAAAKPGYLGGAHGLVAAAPALAYGGVHAGYAAYGPAPVAVGPGGYLLDTPAVAAARGAHLAAVAQTRARDAAVAHLAYAAAPALGLGYGHGLAYGAYGHGLGYGYGHGYHG
ncbi:cuticle protein 64-like [Schistocerca nitens]|uniref:cuticle protein 64-like n=1 Tax=Schistocerca cancellata TaxID=274614 RepID=UPI0021178692|nr:cuticle protein 64-like [Schistocerca cancellata]XP_049810988.1 cuticle protein 64-like [Schistocerca nitens]